MVIGENDDMAAQQQQQQPQQIGPPPATIDNIMSGISNTGTVKMNNHRKKLRQRFDIIKKLGQGTYGKVQLGINKETGQEVAIKTIKKCKIETDADLIRIRREVQIMSSVQHPNIIHIYEVFENREKMVLVMEFAAGGELYDYLSERKVLSEEEARRVFRQISTAVYYCHKHKICHRDLKLENILLDEKGNAKIADFGLSNVFDEQRLLATFCGSPLYASPEIVKGTPYQGPEVDCWSLGVLLYTLVYGAMPFDGSNFKRLVKQISAGDYYEPKKPSPASPLIKEMLTVCPQRRSTIEQICNHWWVNLGYPGSCLELAEELANQTPVRLDVLLSLAPSAVTSDQLVVPGPVEENKQTDRVARSHSVGSIREMGSTEAERRILDMVAAGGEAALAPSPTRTLTPSESPAQPKRKLENTMSSENADAIVKKKEKSAEQLGKESSSNIYDKMEIDPEIVPKCESKQIVNEEQLQLNVEQNPATDDPIAVETIPSELKKVETEILKEDMLQIVEGMCNELLNESPTDETATKNNAAASPEKKKVLLKKKIVKTDSAVVAPTATAATTEEKKKSPVKLVKKIVTKTKTADLTEKLPSPTTTPNIVDKEPAKVQVERKGNLPEELRQPSGERRRSRIFEVAEKFQNMNSPNNEGLKKIIIPGVSVGSFKKEFERKASLTSGTISLPTERRPSFEKRGSDSSGGGAGADSRKSSIGDSMESNLLSTSKEIVEKAFENAIEKINETEGIVESESKSSLASFSLEEARRSMENSIALLNQARTESSQEVDQLCAKTKNVAVSDGGDSGSSDRLKKLKNAREIIGNAIPVGRLGSGIRKPPVPFGINGRSVSGSVVPSATPNLIGERKSGRLQVSADPIDSNELFKSKPVAVTTLINSPLSSDSGTTKTSRAEITLKSATLPRRKTAKTEIQLEMKPKVEPSSMRFQTEMQHHVSDLRSAPIREQSPYSPLQVQHRANSLEPQNEHFIPIQRPGFTKQMSNTYRSGSLSRQSTIESDTESNTPTAQSYSSVGTVTTANSTSNAQPIKKSPREFIIPIAVEGGGFVTPRSGSLEPSDSNHTANSASTFSRLSARPSRRINSLISSEDETPFAKLHRHKSIGRESDNDEPRFAMHRLRTTRPIKKIVQDPNDTGSSGEDDDEDGFELLTAENLFSTLLSRVRALTNRLNVTNEPVSTGFPSSRFMSNLRQNHSPFWNHDPFSSRLNNGTGAWRHSLSRDLTSDIDSMFSRTGATLPRGTKNITKTNNLSSYNYNNNNNNNTNNNIDKSSNNSINNNNNNSSNNKIDDVRCSVDNTTSNNQFYQNNNETLDLTDLDLSRLRLTKQDLETLSNLTPALPKHFQDQLLAQLPPNQARKLSRTLSMQNPVTSQNPVKIYKRSLSGGRENNNEINETDDAFDSRNNLLRRSLSRSRQTTPQLNNKTCDDAYKYYDTLPRRSCESPIKEYNGRPPSGCLSPPPTPSVISQSALQRPPQRRISRFLRPDFFDTPQEDSIYVRDRKEHHDIETQNILRKIRERSRDRSLGRSVVEPSSFSDRSYYSNIDPVTMRERRKSSIPNIGGGLAMYQSGGPATESKLPEMCCDKAGENLYLQRRRRSLSKSNENYNTTTLSPVSEPPLAKTNDISNNNNESLPQSNSFTDKILDELQSNSTSSNNTPVITTSAVDDKRDKIDETNIKKPKVLIRKIKKKVPENSVKEEPSCGAVDCNDKPETSKIIEDAGNINNVKMVKTLTNEIDSMPKVIKVSKLARPKSYPNKDAASNADNLNNLTTNTKIQPVCTKVDQVESISIENNNKKDDDGSTATTAKPIRPKSYPASKITPPKEIKRVLKTTDEDQDSVNATTATIPKIEKEKPLKSTESSADKPKTIVKKVKIIKKVVKSDSSSASTTTAIVNSDKTATIKASTDAPATNETSSTEKKPKGGFLYSIGQKFEKLRENSKNKLKNSSSKSKVVVDENNIEKSKEGDEVKLVKKLRSLSPPLSDVSKNVAPIQSTSTELSSSTPMTISDNDPVSKTIERKSRIDAMIRNLRERSLPRKSNLTESGLIKRAVSVEDMTGETFNKNAVNKVLGLFKKIAKDQEYIVHNTKSSSHIESMYNGGSCRERPKSVGFVGKFKKSKQYQGAKSSDQITNVPEHLPTKIPLKYSPSLNCPDCHPSTHTVNEKDSSPSTTTTSSSSNVTKRNFCNDNLKSIEDKERMRNNRRGLVLDFTKLTNIDSPAVAAADTQTSQLNNNQNINNNNYNNLNNNFIETNNLLTPSSYDSRSLHDDCASTSTFLSPTDEPELYFDDWSVCSEDNYRNDGTISSASTAHLSRGSQGTSPISTGGISRNSSLNNGSESVIDRIKRRSYYCRFNENRPKRQSNIVGPAAREYYREVAAKLKSRPPERVSSPPILEHTSKLSSTNTHEYYRPIKTDNDVVGSSANYNRHQHHHHHHQPQNQQPQQQSIKYKYDDELKNYRPSEYLRTKSSTNYNLPIPSQTSAATSSSKLLSHASDNDYHHHNMKYSSNTDYHSLSRPSRSSTIYLPDSISQSSTLYNPKRRTISASSSSGPPTSSTTMYSNGDSAASAGGSLKKTPRPYNHRSISMLDSYSAGSSTSSQQPASCSVANNGSCNYRREHHRGVTYDFGNITSRPNIRIRTPSVSQDSTNI